MPKKKMTDKINKETEEVKFCLECNDMDDLAVDPQLDEKAAKERFKNCRDTGKFNGDVCSRLYVINLDNENLLGDEDL